MRKKIQKLSKVFLAFVMMFQTFGGLPVAFAAELEADNQNKVIIGLNESHMWSNDNGHTWQIGNENQRFLGNQVVQVAYLHEDGIDIPGWESRVYDGTQVGDQVRHEGNIYQLQWYADATDIPSPANENTWDSPWLWVRPAHINIIGTFTFATLEGEAAEQFQKDEAQRIQNQKKVIGYFANWQGYKTDVFPNNPSHLDVPGLIDGQGYDPVNVPLDKLSHVNYAFIVIDENGLPVLHDEWADSLDDNGEGRNYIGQLARLTREHDVTFMMSVGGWTNSLEGYFDIATETPEKIEAFTDALVEMMLKYEFDGIDIDWEFPENDDQKERFIVLIQQLREKLTAEGMQRDKYYQLSAAVTANHEKMPYIAPSETHPYLDSVNVMSYDFRGAWEEETGHHSPLYPRADDAEQKFNTSAAMEEYVSVYGVPKNKLMVGIGYYSRGWSGVESDEVGAPATGPAIGAWDDPDELAGFNTWFHMKAMEQDPENIVGWDDEAKVPYLYNPKNQEFYTYDNPRSVQYKVDYIFEQDFGGAIIWELSNDTTDYELGSIVAEILDEQNWKLPEVVNVGNFSELEKAILEASPKEPTVIAITNSFDFNGLITINDGKDITIKSNSNSDHILRQTSSDSGINMRSYRHFSVENNSTLTLGNGVILDGSGNQAAVTGGVLVNGDSANFTMDGGHIKNTKAAYGAVELRAGYFTIIDGTISHHTATAIGGGGGGVYINGGHFTMRGGTISDNAATNDSGGGVKVLRGTFTMEDGEIKRNTTRFHGGGVSVFQEGTFNMNGGTITENNASSYGGVSVLPGGTFNRTGGVINNNTPNNY